MGPHRVGWGVLLCTVSSSCLRRDGRQREVWLDREREREGEEAEEQAREERRGETSRLITGRRDGDDVEHVMIGLIHSPLMQHTLPPSQVQVNGEREG